jgi:hypothetical protein
MARPCKLCVHCDQVAVRSAFASGATDREIGRKFGLSHVSAGRHRREHLVRPLQAAVTALDRGRAVRAQRNHLMRAVELGDPTAIFGLDAIAADIARIAARLDASADEAASVGQHTAHAALASQLLRQIEMRTKLGGHDKPNSSAAEGQRSSINIYFASTGETVSINTPLIPASNHGGEDELEASLGTPDDPVTSPR